MVTVRRYGDAPPHAPKLTHTQMTNILGTMANLLKYEHSELHKYSVDMRSAMRTLVANTYGAIVGDRIHSRDAVVLGVAVHVLEHACKLATRHRIETPALYEGVEGCFVDLTSDEMLALMALMR